jgi:hypothetical protein
VKVVLGCAPMFRLAVLASFLAAGCASNALTLTWGGKPVVAFDLFQRPEALAGPIDASSLTCWRARADVDHGGFFVMKMSRGTYALRFCVQTAYLLEAKKKGQTLSAPARIDVSGEEDLVHAIQKMRPACGDKPGPLGVRNVKVPESTVSLTPDIDGVRLDFDTTFGVFLDIDTALEDEAVHLFEERGLTGSFLAKGEPVVTDRGRVRCTP